MAIPISIKYGLPVFGIIKIILIDHTVESHFIVSGCTCHYSEHLHCYSLTETEHMVLVKFCELLDYYSLCIYTINGLKYVTTKHFICLQ
jgi:hypothetical protein